MPGADDLVGIGEVLLVEEDEQTLELLRIELTNAGLRVVAISNFLEARRYLAGHTPDALITDVRLGAYNGLQLVLQLKSEHPQCRVVVVSGYEDPVLRQEAVRFGAAYLVEPFSGPELLDELSG